MFINTSQDELNTTREICDDLFGDVQSSKTSKTVVEIHCENDVSADEVRARIRDAYATAQRLKLVEIKLKETEPEMRRLRNDLKRKSESLTTMRARWMEETSLLQNKLEAFSSSKLVERYKKLKRRAESVQNQLEQTVNSNRDLTTRLEESSKLSQRLQRELSPLYDVDRRLKVSQENVELLEQRVDEFRDRELEIQRKLSASRERCERLKEEKRRIMERDVANLRDEVQRLNREQERNVKRLKECEETELNLKTRLEELEGENLKLRRENHQLHTTFSSSDGRRKNAPNLILPIPSKTQMIIRDAQNRVRELECELRKRGKDCDKGNDARDDRKRLEITLDTLRERDEECEKLRDMLNVIVGKYDFDEEMVEKKEITEEVENVTVEFSESFLGFTLLSTENSEHPAIISKFQRFEDGSMGPAEACGLLGVGDALVSIDGNSVVGMEYDEVVSELRKADRPVRIEWSRKFYRPTKLVSLSTIKKVRLFTKKNICFDDLIA